jgi:hypothetical protein
MAIAYSVAIPGLQTYLFRRTSPDLIANHLSGPSGFPALLADLIDQKQVQINYSKNEIRFSNGSTVHLCHCQHEKDRFGYQGAEIHFLLMDELTHFTETIYRFLRSRVRMTGLKVPEEYKDVVPRIVAGTNPGGEGHNWVKKTFIDFAPPYEVVKTPKEEGGFRRQFIPALLTDNPALLESDPEYADRLSGLGTDAYVRAMLEGSWDIAEGGYFDDVWSRNIHAVKPFDIPSSWHIDRSFDWGSSKPYSVGFWAESDGTEATLNDGTKKMWPRGTIFRIGEIYGWNGEADTGTRELASEVAAKIIEYLAGKPWGKRCKPGAADGAIYNKENGDCIADDMSALGIRWTRADKRPGSRVTGWLNMRKKLKASMKSPMEEPGLFIFDTCTQFIRTVPTLPRDPNNSEDVHSKAEDHIADEVRYRLNSKRMVVGTVEVTGL